MDARTFVDTQVVGHELRSKRRWAAEERLAGKARQEAVALGWRRGRRRIGSTALATRVVAALIAALLAATLVGQTIEQRPGETARSDRGGHKQLAMRGQSSSPTHQLVRGRGASPKLLMVRGHGTASTRKLIASSGVAHKRARFSKIQ